MIISVAKLRLLFLYISPFHFPPQEPQDLDAAVFEAYGWPATLTDEEILARLVALNQERAAEEKRGLIRWLRPEFQAPKDAAGVRGATSDQQEIAMEAESREGAPSSLKSRSTVHDQRSTEPPWPKTLAAQVQALRALLATRPPDASAAALAGEFKGAPKARIAEILETLSSLGQI